MVPVALLEEAWLESPSLLGCMCDNLRELALSLAAENLPQEVSPWTPRAENCPALLPLSIPWSAPWARAVAALERQGQGRPGGGHDASGV